MQASNTKHAKVSGIESTGWCESYGLNVGCLRGWVRKGLVSLKLNMTFHA